MKQVQFLKKAVDILCQCRQTLMYTYVFAYYLRKNNQSVIFEVSCLFSKFSYSVYVLHQRKKKLTRCDVLLHYLRRNLARHENYVAVNCCSAYSRVSWCTKSLFMLWNLWGKSYVDWGYRIKTDNLISIKFQKWILIWNIVVILDPFLSHPSFKCSSFWTTLLSVTL